MAAAPLIGRKVPWREKIALGLGYLSAQGSHSSIHILAQPVLSVTMGLSPGVVSTLTFIQRLWDAFLDPLCGRFSDRLRTRWGRRRPIMFVGAFPLALFFILLWRFPEQAGAAALFLYVLSFSLLFYIGHTLFSVPLYCLQLEATTDYHERTRVAAFSIAFCLFFEIALNWIFPFAQRPIFAGAIAGVRWITGGLGLLFLGFALVPVFVLRERLDEAPAPSLSTRKIGWSADLRAILDNRPFLQVLGMRGVANFCYYLVQIFGMYMNFYYVHGGDIKGSVMMQGWLATSFQLASVASSLTFRTLSVGIGKRGSIMLAACGLIAGGVAKLFVYDAGIPWLQLIVYSLNGAAVAGITMLTTSMLADVVDYAELKDGQRREGLHVAFLTWADKLGNSLGTLVSGFILVWLGFRTKVAHQAPAMLQGMKLTYACIPAAGALTVILIARCYRIDESRARAIREELDAAGRAPAVNENAPP